MNPELFKPCPDYFSLVSLPIIHDLLYLPEIGKQTPELIPSINNIIEYIMTREYQNLPGGYGIGFNGKRFYAIGWSITIPSFHNYRLENEALFYLIHLSHFKIAHRSPWFTTMLKTLSEYKVADNIYEFPRNSIQEKKNAYFVGGHHLGVVENRRLKKRNQMESTYWYHVIRKNMKNAI